MTRTRRRRSRSPAPARIDPRPWLRAIGWGAALVLLGFGFRALDVSARETGVRPTRIEWVDVPAWLRTPEWNHVLPGIEAGRHLSPAAPLVHADTDIFHPRVCAFVHEAVSLSPWVEQVERVTKRRDGRVRIRARFREPFTTIEQDDVAYLVDASGVRLPAEWRAAFQTAEGHLPIRGVSGRVPRLGERWRGNDVSAGLALAAFFYRNEKAGNVPFRDELRAIDVSDFDQILGKLRIITINPRSYIYWGHVPGEGSSVEDSAEEKLAKLLKLYQDWGRLPDRGPFTVRFPGEVTFMLGRTD